VPRREFLANDLHLDQHRKARDEAAQGEEDNIHHVDSFNPVLLPVLLDNGEEEAVTRKICNAARMQL
jgi:hypothetical protein